MNQNAIVIWLLGLSGAGKSTLASLLEEKLSYNGFFSVLLDGDNLRSGINKDLSFGNNDRSENVRRAAEMAKILLNNNIITICSFITPLQEQRDLARDILQKNYFEVFVDCPLEVCEKRDVKGLYKKARAKKISNFTGISSGFERVTKPDLILSTSKQTPQRSAEVLYDAILPFIS